MLILNVVLLLGVASKTTSLAVSPLPPSEKTAVSSTSKTKRDFTTPSTSVNLSTEPNSFRGKQFNLPYTSTSISYETSQSGTTTKTVAPNPSQSVTYSPRQNFESSHSPSTHGHNSQSTIAPPYLQSGFQASHGFQRPLKPWISQSSPRTQSKVAPNINYNSQYFPNSYRVYPESGKALQQSKLSPFSVGGENFPNSFAGTRPNRQSPTDLPFENPKFRFNPSPAFSVQASPFGNSPQRFKNPYQSSSFLSPKQFNSSPTSVSSEFSGAPNFSPFNKLGDNYQYGGLANVGYPTKEVSLPNSLQFSKNSQTPAFNHVFQNKPVNQNTGLDFQTQPSSGSSFGFTKPIPPSLPTTSFSPTNGNYQPRVLPVHSSSSTPQLPRYKGASINKYSSNEQSKPDTGYQLLANQPQLHFTRSTPLQTIGGHRPVVYHSSSPFEQIRSDVEVINKKKPELPKPGNGYDPESDEGFKSEYEPGQFTPDDDDDELSTLVKNPIRDVSFEVPSSNLFNSYDEAFGKYSKLASLQQDVVKVASKPGFRTTEDDNDKGDKSGEYGSIYSEGRVPTSISSFEDDDDGEEESRRSERLKARDEREYRNNKDHDNYEPNSYKSYGVDYEKEYEESYRRDLPKTEYVHVKEVPEIEDAAPEWKKRKSNRSSTKPSRNGGKQKTRQVQGEYTEPKGYESYTTHEYASPKVTYKDNEGHDSKNSYRKNSEPENSEPYGYKVPRDRGSMRYVKNDDSKIRVSDEDEEQTHLRRSSENQEAKSSRPYGDSKHSSKFTSSSSSSAEASTQPSGKQVSRAIDSYEAPNRDPQFVNTDQRDYRLPYVHREGLKYFANGQAVRDLTGI